MMMKRVVNAFPPPVFYYELARDRVDHIGRKRATVVPDRATVRIIVKTKPETDECPEPVALFARTRTAITTTYRRPTDLPRNEK